MTITAVVDHLGDRAHPLSKDCDLHVPNVHTLPPAGTLARLGSPERMTVIVTYCLPSRSQVIGWPTMPAGEDEAAGGHQRAGEVRALEGHCPL